MGFLNPMNRIWNIPFCSTNTCKGVDAYTHTHKYAVSPEQSDKAALSEKKGARGEGGGCCVIMAFTKSLLCHRLKCLLGEH